MLLRVTALSPLVCCGFEKRYASFTRHLIANAETRRVAPAREFRFRLSCGRSRGGRWTRGCALRWCCGTGPGLSAGGQGHRLPTFDWRLRASQATLAAEFGRSVEGRHRLQRVIGPSFHSAALSKRCFSDARFCFPGARFCFPGAPFCLPEAKSCLRDAKGRNSG